MATQAKGQCGDMIEEVRPTPEQIERWMRMAESDLDAAGRTAGVEAYNVAAFLCQQAVEKMLKAAHLAVRQEEAERTHTLARLLEGLDAPPELVAMSYELTKDHVATRYPDAQGVIPPEAYGRPEAEDRLRRAEGIMSWARRLIEEAQMRGSPNLAAGTAPKVARKPSRISQLERLRRTSDPMVQHFAAELLPRLREHWRPQHVLLHGSRVRGDAHEWSDLDVIVVSEAFKGTRFLDRMSAVGRALDHPVGIEMFCYTPEEFDRKRREPGVVATACREGIWLD